MIKELQYVSTTNGVQSSITADKNVAQRNAWHLASVKGNGFPSASALGDASHGLAGTSYNGLDIGARTIDAELYADGFSALATQEMLEQARVALTLNSTDVKAELDSYLRLTNGAGEVRRIAAKCTEFELLKQYMRVAKVSTSFYCPYAFFEDDTLSVRPLFAVTGGKEYPLDRPYTFGEMTQAAADVSVTLRNEGDIPAPCVFKLYGSGMTAVTITNLTTDTKIIISGAPSVGGIVINTDYNNTYAKFIDGRDASRYVSLFSAASQFVLRPGSNSIRVQQTASSITQASTCIEWRGRYSSCL